MKRLFPLATLLFALLSAVAQVPDGYYNAAVGKSGEQLRTALYSIIKSHTVLDYNDLWSAYRSTDVMPSGYVWDIYSDNPDGTAPYYYNFGQQCGNYSHENQCYNREHTIPQSWFNDATPMKTDLFHVYPTDGFVNGKRANWAYGEVEQATWTSQNGSKLGPCTYPGCSGTAFEPIDAFKGDLARGFFYMSVCYKDKNFGQASESVFTGSELVSWARNMFVAWHNADPVSQKEIDRNNVIYSQFQHNRNPFIDCPELVDYLFGSRQNDPWYPTCVEWNQTDIENYHLADYQDSRIYPNPASNQVNIKSNYLNINIIEIFDVTGRQVKSFQNVNDKTALISTEDIPSGCYFVKVITDQTTETLKLIIK